MEKFEHQGNRNIEQNEQFPCGEYTGKIEFMKHSGEKGEFDIETSLTLREGDDIEVLEKRAGGWAASLGLHNFGLEPKIPVVFTLTSQEHPQIQHVFSRQVGADGFVSKVDQ